MMSMTGRSMASAARLISSRRSPLPESAQDFHGVKCPFVPGFGDMVMTGRGSSPPKRRSLRTSKAPSIEAIW